jgi:GNAT superfamily N-acetyltransferase
MIIREVVIGDYKDLCSLNKNGLGYDYPEEKTKEKLRLVLSLPTDRIFVAELDGKLAGYIHLSAYECIYFESLKNILALVVDVNYRNQGIGRQLILAGEEWAKETGSKGIRLSSGFNRTDAHQFYQHCGYTMRKEQKNFMKLF